MFRRWSAAFFWAHCRCEYHVLRMALYRWIDLQYAVKIYGYKPKGWNKRFLNNKLLWMKFIDRLIFFQLLITTWIVNGVFVSTQYDNF